MWCPDIGSSVVQFKQRAVDHLSKLQIFHTPSTKEFTTVVSFSEFHIEGIMPEGRYQQNG
jgi:hypothetical protein